MRHAYATAVGAALTLGGCASMEPGKGFDDVQKDVTDRTGLRTHWNNGSEEDAEAARAVDAMLADELTADEAVQVALLNNHDLQATYEELNLAQADIVQAGLLRNPVFDAQIRFAEGGAGIAYDFALTEDFLSLLYMPLQKERAGAAFELAKARVTGEVMDLAGKVRDAYFELQGAEQTKEMRHTVLEAMAASYDLAGRLREAGNSRELDFLNERAVYEQAKLDLAAAESSAGLGRERLNVLMGLWGTQTSWRVTPRLPEAPEEAAQTTDLERRAIEKSLDLAVVRREIEVAARTLGVAGPWGWLAESDIGVAANREVDGPWTIGPAFSLPIPLFDQGQGRQGASRARLKQATERYTAMAVEVRARARAAAGAAEAARERAVYYQKVMIPLRHRIVEETQLQYNAMQVSPFQLLQARRDEVEAGGQYILALRDYWLAQSRLEQTLSGRMAPMEGMSVSLGRTSESSLGAGQGGHR